MCLLFQTDLPEKIYRTPTAPTQGSNHKGPRLFNRVSQMLLDGIHHLRLVPVRVQVTGSLPCLYGRQGQSTCGGACKPSVETEGRDPPTFLIGQEFEII